ncbi:MAG: substrate-binding domain-containing protein [Pirellulaceae bacterium]|nr:substrate-binding domain-containing protein [Pirellulaceae bacterium]
MTQQNKDTEMLRSGLFAIWALGWLVVLSSTRSASAEQPAAGSMCSIERLQSVLQSIDPYQPQQVVSGKLALFGSSTMDGMAHAWVDQFRQFHADAVIEVSSIGESQAVERICSEPSSMWLVSRPVTPAELESLKSKGMRRPIALEVARQALGIFVHQSNPVTSISGEQMRSIFTDESTGTPTWKLLGATGALADQPIRIISRTEDSGTHKYLKESVFRSNLREGLPVASNAEIVDVIKTDPLAIGICGLKCGYNEARALSLQAGGNTIPSDEMAILSGQYPLVRPLSIVLDLGQAQNKLAIEFVRYVLSQSGQAENVLAGYFPVDLPLIRAELAQLASTAVR